MTRQAIVRAAACGCIAVAAAVPFAVGSRVAAQDGAPPRGLCAVG